jgi:hypothetical protein
VPAAYWLRHAGHSHAPHLLTFLLLLRLRYCLRSAGCSHAPQLLLRLWSYGLKHAAQLYAQQRLRCSCWPHCS